MLGNYQEGTKLVASQVVLSSIDLVIFITLWKKAAIMPGFKK
jgi:hypothetical protein